LLDHFAPEAAEHVESAFLEHDDVESHSAIHQIIVIRGPRP
jgi:hypothetical protein